MSHIPVLYHEVLEALQVRPHGRYIDGTLGAGGHTRGILKQGGRVLAFDWDPEAIEFARQQLAEWGDQVQFVNASYAEMGQFAPAYGFGEADGILMDLGLSSRQLDNPTRGFAFRYEAPLDMRFDPRTGQTAADLLNTWPATALADIFWRYGEEKQSRKLAQALVENRPWATTKQLADFIATILRNPRGRSHIHPATRIFQALRIAVNGELEALEKGLAAAVKLLAPSGRLAVISFHSLEDRLVKNHIRDLSQEPEWSPAQLISNWQPTLKRISRKPIGPGTAELTTNPRSRSAKLRIAEKVLSTK